MTVTVVGEDDPTVISDHLTAQVEEDRDGAVTAADGTQAQVAVTIDGVGRLDFEDEVFDINSVGIALIDFDQGSWNWVRTISRRPCRRASKTLALMAQATWS